MMKKIAAIVIAVCLAAGWGIRVYHVNRNLKKSVVKVYDKGQVVPIGKDFFDKSTEDMDGYTVKVLDSELVSSKDFLTRYKERSGLLGKDVDYLYVIKIAVKNEYNMRGEETGIDLFQYMLQGTDYVLRINDIAYKLTMPNMDGNLAFSLRRGKEPMEFILPFEVMTRSYTTVDHLKADTPKLVVSQYPNKKMLKIK